MSTPGAPRGYESWAEYDRRASAEAGITPFSPDAAALAERDPEFVAQWLRANCLDFRDAADDPDASLVLRRSVADRVRGVAEHFLSITGGDYTTEGK